MFVLEANFILNKEHFTFHLQYKHSCTFANRKYEELSYPHDSAATVLVFKASAFRY